MSTPEFYANARAYDIAFGDRDYADECRFLEWCWRAHGATTERSFLELACGPGRHAQQFARLGWRAVGLDLSEDMLIYADEVARPAGVLVDWRIGNMVDYSLPEPVGLVGCLMESLTHLVTNEEVVTHLRAVARSLVSGGVYVIEMAHPDSMLPNSLRKSGLSSRMTGAPSRPWLSTATFTRKCDTTSINACRRISSSSPGWNTSMFSITSWCTWSR